MFFFIFFLGAAASIICVHSALLGFADERRELLVKEVEGWKAQADNSKLPPRGPPRSEENETAGIVIQD